MSSESQQCPICHFLEDYDEKLNCWVCEICDFVGVFPNVEALYKPRFFDRGPDGRYIPACQSCFGEKGYWQDYADPREGTIQHWCPCQCSPDSNGYED